MKKNLRVFAASMLAVLMLVLTACGSGEAPAELAGKWQLTAIRSGGMEMTVADLEDMDDSISITFTLNFINGKDVEVEGIMSGLGEDMDENETGKYTFENGTVVITEKDGKTEAMTLELVDGELLWNFGGTEMVFTRV